MISLLDANFLIALFDAAHVRHMDAHQWLSQHRTEGWATCPLTQNACIRILSQPAYPGRLTIPDISRRLHHAISVREHHFWHDSISLCDTALIAHDKILGAKHLTDIYLLALATTNGGRLVTFDRNIPIAAVKDAKEWHIEIL